MKRFVTGLLITLALGLLLTGCGQTDKTEKETTEMAPLTSGLFLDNMDKSVRPQDNFYNYVNGTWNKTAVIPSDRTSDGAFYELREKSRSDIKAIIDELAARSDLKSGTPEQKVSDLYNSVVDTARINSLGISPISDELAAIDNLNNKSAMSRWLGRSQQVGAGGAFHLFVSIDDKNATRYIPGLWQGGLGLPDRDYYFNDEENFRSIRKAYVVHMEKMFRLAGWKNPARTAQIIMDLETEIAQLHWTNVENRDSEKLYNLTTIADISQRDGAFDWSAFWDAAGIDQRYDLNINQPSYIDGFTQLFDEKSLETWKLYFKWNLLNNAAGFLSSDFDDQNFDFYNRTLSGQQEQRPRWKRGVDMVNGVLGEVVGQVYVSRHFTPEAKVRMMDLVENLRSAYGVAITNLEWMSEDTKTEALRKLAAFTPKIGYPDRWRDYTGLQVQADDLVGNISRTRLFNYQDSLAKLDEPIRTWEWGMSPQTVNAYYSPSRNEVVFPAAILQPPFFNLEADDAVNYGGIGAVIGHEMGHGFDDQGSLYDGDGNMRNWWTEADLAEFGKRTQGLVNQYSEFEVLDDLFINGELTLGENIGDLSGVTIAYKAYHMSEASKNSPVLDGFSGEQRFFMGFGQVWRSKYTEEELRNRVATDVHSPSEFRPIGSLSNFTPFYAAFDVQKGDKMFVTPEKRVKIW